jgi:hypothetical protein
MKKRLDRPLVLVPNVAVTSVDKTAVDEPVVVTSVDKTAVDKPVVSIFFTLALFESMIPAV